MEVIQFTAGSSHTEEQYAFVDVLHNNGNMLIENVEIPFSLGKALLERAVDSFPCLLIHINDRQELIALPKFKWGNYVIRPRIIGISMLAKLLQP